MFWFRRKTLFGSRLLLIAISRAQYAAVVVASDVLTEYLPGSPDGLIDLGAFLTLIDDRP